MTGFTDLSQGQEGYEACDDGNNIPNDGCNNECVSVCAATVKSTLASNDDRAHRRLHQQQLHGVVTAFVRPRGKKATGTTTGTKRRRMSNAPRLALRFHPSYRLEIGDNGYEACMTATKRKLPYHAKRVMGSAPTVRRGRLAMRPATTATRSNRDDPFKRCGDEPNGSLR